MWYSILFTAVLLVAGLAQHDAHADGGPTQAELNAAAQSTEWLLPNRDYAGQRSVDLKQITHQNAMELRPVCIYQAGDVRPFQTNPLVYHGVMYVTTPSSTIALDAATCAVRWRHDWQSKARNAEVKVGEIVVNPYRSRGAALKDGKLIRSTSDGYLIALEINTGKLVWEKHVAEAEKYELMIMAPLVYEDLVISGIGISEYASKVGSARSGYRTASRYGDLIRSPARANLDSTPGAARMKGPGVAAGSG
jgi:alcohol dehydrogenase (cytochrome c)